MLLGIPLYNCGISGTNLAIDSGVMNHVNNLRLQNGIHLIMRQNHNFVKSVGKPNIINLGCIYKKESPSII